MSKRLVVIAALLAGVCVAWLASGSADPASGAVATSGVQVAPAAAGAQPPRAADLPGSIVFVSERDGNREIYRLTPATGAEQRLTHDEQADYPVAVGPEGDLLAVRASDPEAEVHLEQLRLIGDGDEHAIAALSKHVRNPVWLPDGAGLIFEADYHGFREIYRLSLDGRQERGTPERLTDAPEGNFEPAVEPGGAAIAFVSSRGGDAEIYRLELKGGALSRLTWSRGEDTHPIYSPNGKVMAFVSSRTGVPAVYLMEPNGAHPRPIHAPASESIGQLDPVFSPDGSLIAFVEQRPGRAGIRVVRVADGELVARSDGDWIDQSPTFSPDGRYVAFSSSRDGDTELYAMAVATGAAVRLTRSSGADWLPRWQ